ncbi:NAD(P)-binding protein [Aspergillus affinis]|uniref:NAD(P)-binding protein n=1 Tax=Aspergillus affinis TaxID=1070780 RepID=UPI0022FF44CA|nr:NAD(P)-binding protein [Aspergillus affinis]KAI9036613.1 NAD(P)-binding protein [Aspergillus affinis]
MDSYSRFRKQNRCFSSQNSEKNNYFEILRQTASSAMESQSILVLGATGGSAMKAHSVTTVVSFLGAYVSASAIVTRNVDTPIADSIPTVIQTMEKNKIKRLLALSTLSYWVEGRDVSNRKLTIYGMMPKLFAPQGNAEMVRIAETVIEKASHLDWTIFRVPHLTDGPAELPVWAGYAGPNHRGGLNLSRKSLARWVLGEITQGEWVKGLPFLGVTRVTFHQS